MVDKAFIVKITNSENIEKIQSNSEFIHKDIYNFESDIKQGDTVFIYFGGDKSQISWEQGLAGYGEITAEPYDKGYDPSKPRNFKIKIQPKLILEHSIPPKKTKIHRKYAHLFYDIPYVGANHFPNQAIAKFEGKDRLTALKSILNYSDIEVASTSTSLPKPFILLSGISGTGKTRFVKQQAQKFRHDDSNYKLVPVRPDWHEPSDLLGYVSRLGADGTEYIVTDFLIFLVSAWKEMVERVDVREIIYNLDAVPFWLCLDEMNLAPVEQYFADYLSVIESRQWNDGQYQCEPLLNASILADHASKLRVSLKLEGEVHDALWDYFITNGISIPPNLIVAGTVNMDETTHGFSRKVIDRAFTLDFGDFFPNNFDAYFADKTQPKALSYPVLSRVEEVDLVDYDKSGIKSVAFLKEINSVLKSTPFELAYRALNELLLAVVCFQAKTDNELQAVWDDFLMTKVLPRIEGDAEKLGDDGENSLLSQLNKILEQQLPDIWDHQRIDLLRENIDGSTLTVDCRSKSKIKWMQTRLENNGFTSFWP